MFRHRLCRYSTTESRARNGVVYPSEVQVVASSRQPRPAPHMRLVLVAVTMFFLEMGPALSVNMAACSFARLEDR
jgi:hypothetical protein